MENFEKYLEEEGFVSLEHMEENGKLYCESSYYINKRNTIGLHKITDIPDGEEGIFYMYSIGKKDGKEKEIVTMINFIDDILDLDDIVLNITTNNDYEPMLKSHLEAVDDYTLFSDEKRIKDNLKKLSDRGKEFAEIFENEY